MKTDRRELFRLGAGALGALALPVGKAAEVPEKKALGIGNLGRPAPPTCPVSLPSGAGGNVLYRDGMACLLRREVDFVRDEVEVVLCRPEYVAAPSHGWEAIRPHVLTWKGQERVFLRNKREAVNSSGNYCLDADDACFLEVPIGVVLTGAVILFRKEEVIPFAYFWTGPMVGNKGDMSFVWSRDGMWTITG